MKVRRKHYRRSPLVQGGLEVPCEVSVRMSGSIVNHTLLQRYKALLRELYTKPKEEDMGKFLSGGVVFRSNSYTDRLKSRWFFPKIGD